MPVSFLPVSHRLLHLQLHNKTDRQATAIKAKRQQRLDESSHRLLPAESVAGYHSPLKGPKQLGFHIRSFYTLEGRHRTGRKDRIDYHLLYTSLTTLPSETARNTTDRPWSQLSEKDLGPCHCQLLDNSHSSQHKES